MKNSSLTAIVLAAGKGTRMKSPLPKVLHPVAGRPLVQWVIDALKPHDFHEIRAVVGAGESLVRPFLEGQGVTCCRQEQQRGTGDAVKSAMSDSMEGTVLIINGDHPLVGAEHIEQILKSFNESDSELALVTAEVPQPGQLGRVVRHYESVQAIVEAKDASQETLKINEVNTGIYLCTANFLKEALPELSTQNAQGEYYLTDIVSYANEKGLSVQALKMSSEVAFGVNSQKELSLATKILFRKKANQLMNEGVMIIDPQNCYVEPTVVVDSGAVIYPGVFLKGSTRIGAFCVLEPNCFVNDSQVGQGAQIRAGSYLEGAVVHAKATVGPYGRLRPGADIGEEAHVGNFVEVKKAKLGARSKAGHLAYIGDATIGEDTNIGCGTITCNYAVDKKKYTTKIGDRVFVGSDSQFVAPVEIGDDAVIGSGSTITKDVPKGALAVARGRQMVKEGWTEKNNKQD